MSEKKPDGEAAEARGAMKEALGMIVGDDEVRAEGAAAKAEGEAKAKTAEAAETRRVRTHP